jgi:predicted PurR-regulated permease PerM
VIIGPDESPDDRRRRERRTDLVLGELTLPEVRRIVITSTLFLVVLGLFLWMVRTVLIAGLLALILATYLRPLHERFREWTRQREFSALLTIIMVIVPVLAAIVYSYVELRDAAFYVASNQNEIIAQIDQALRRLPLLEGQSFTDQIRNAVLVASNYGTEIVSDLQETAADLVVSAAVFLFTMFYVLTSGSAIGDYFRPRIPARYSELAATLERNVSGVLYGTIYATLLTQTLKSLIILAMNLIFGVPLAFVLAILSFVIGFFPIVGSWSVYVPVAGWLLVFGDSWVSALIVLAVGFFGNTLLFSLYIRPKIAAEKSRVLDFFWMFVGLVTGVYTFGVAGILLGPVIIGMLKATLDTVTGHESWKLLGADGEPGPVVKEA